MTKTLFLAALTVTLSLTACASAQASANRPVEAWRMAVKANFARLAYETPSRAPAQFALTGPCEAWQLAVRPNAARLAAPNNSPARPVLAGQRAMISRVNKALPL